MTFGQLDVDGTSGGLAELAYGWIEHLSTTMPASTGQIEVTRWPAPMPEPGDLSGAGPAWLPAGLDRELPIQAYVAPG